MNSATKTAPASGHPHNISLGRRGEDIAAQWLCARDYRIVDRNWRCSRGEVDIVAWDGDTLVFVEVKTRAGTTGGHPLEAITPRKVARLRRVAGAWCTAHPDVRATALRIDAIAVHDDAVRDEHGIDHVQDCS